ncbi:hypothetical protein [Ectobacillus ponti]|uniref:Uncharacterized protein n=1 Tax=Ectobacillus ponti TaxID=2961894 RepID=A0AA42BR69_9BACI|nr:hypothetical protein [Ectobacillus ponti]MCP8967108.1 hypothetical protein [Ectobacillus ponti]
MTFLQTVQESEFKKGASREQLLFADTEEVEELADDVGYDEILQREHDEELSELLGAELFAMLEQQVWSGGASKEKLISFFNGLGFHLLDLVVVLETQFGVPGHVFTPEVLKKMEKRIPRFPYLEGEKTILDVTVSEAAHILQEVTDGAVQLERT